MPTIANWYHASMDVVSRSQGRSAVGIAAYVTGERMKNTETGVWAKRNHPGDVLAFGTTVPENAPQWLASNDNLARAWNAAQGAETRINSQLARHFNIALSREWSVPDQVDVMESMAEKITERHGVMVTWAIHAPTGHGDTRNAHGHLVFNMRQVGEDGFGKKARSLVDMKTAKKELVWLRGMIADTLNGKLEELGSEERVTHMSFKDRGIEREPTRHRGDKQSQQQLKGYDTPVGNENREIEARNREREIQEQLDRVARELAEVEREIIAEQERALDEKYGEIDHSIAAGELYVPGEPAQILDNLPDREENAELPSKEPETSRSGTPKSEEERIIEEESMPFDDQIRFSGEIRQDGLHWLGWAVIAEAAVWAVTAVVDFVKDKWREYVLHRSGHDDIEYDGPDLGG